jgi:hypothetical protein
MVLDSGFRRHIPKRITHNQEGNIYVLRIIQDLVAARLDHLPVCDDNFPTIVFLLLYISVGAGHGIWRMVSYKDGLVDE